MVTAADRREELEAAIRAKATYLNALTGKYACAVSEAGMTVVLANADIYAEAIASERIAAMTSAQLTHLAEGRRHAEVAAAEHTPARAGRRTRRSTP